ncbi:hypothetical protein BU24DRAFT_428548 [Aaosphaeria arxii CBS 175.79]|uniref:Uncharacterized protein n=1 Tax=Aaosphaeria arxii CBS 175.79 TaxID=1450172 RepID=A0A6A5X9P4_9PLEO|nr:uncharacterized protein BU24DRAFT_428548 [Aaosphaeria arxii CBS 175.79]KAF2009653.1 hypothetical protein BU24DRAFT_428548 [Aaosphaeria arxii CBS 175.79]
MGYLSAIVVTATTSILALTAIASFLYLNSRQRFTLPTIFSTTEPAQHVRTDRETGEQNSRHPIPPSHGLHHLSKQRVYLSIHLCLYLLPVSDEDKATP